MPVTIKGLTSVRVWLSPLVELGSALHALHEPDHHAPWNPSLSANLRDELHLWSFTFRAIRAAPFLPGWPRAGFDLGPPDRLARHLLRPLMGGTRWAAARGKPVAAIVDGLGAGDAAITGRFVAFIRACREEFFDAEWAARRQRLALRANTLTQRLRVEPAAAVLASLITGVEPTVDGIVVHKVKTRHLDASHRGLLVAPSEFAGPHLHLADAATITPSLIFDSGRAKRRAPSTKVLALRLESLANPARLRVCRAVATEWRSAGEVAALWRIDPTRVTKHLRALEEAGLVQSRRSGRFVLYRLDSAVLRGLGEDTLDLLLR